MAEMIRITGANRRVIKFNRVSPVQYLGYFRNKLTRELMSVTVFEYTPGQFEIPGFDSEDWNSLQQVANTILAKY